MHMHMHTHMRGVHIDRTWFYDAIGMVSIKRFFPSE